MIVIGLTGSFASGKTEAAQAFKRKGAVIFDADASARRAVRKGKPAHRAIVKLFGREVLAPSGELDRRKLADRVFGRPKELKKLNLLIHPGVIFDCLAVMRRLKRQKGAVLVMDVPLLFESRMERLADTVIVLHSSRKKIFDRAKKRGLPRGLAAKILASQWPAKTKLQKADFVIENNGSLAGLNRQVSKILDRIQSIHKQKEKTK